MAKFGYTNVPPTYMVAMVMSIITITAPWPRVPLAAAQQTTLSVDAQGFLEAHNQLRATARVANLVWNDSLVAVAKSFVEQQCATMAPCSSGQGVPTYSSGQNSWCIVANGPQLTNAPQTVATSSYWATRSFTSYWQGTHEHCKEEGDGEEGDGGNCTSSGSGAGPSGTVTRPAPAPVGSGSLGSITEPEPPSPLLRSSSGMPPSPDAGPGKTGTHYAPTPGYTCDANGGGPDTPPTPSLVIVPGTGSSNDGEEGDGEEGDHKCDAEGDGEGDGGDGGNAAQYFAQMVDDKTVSTGCYSIQCAANGVSYAACGYYPNPPPAHLTKWKG